jgi:hypothetical protein
MGALKPDMFIHSYLFMPSKKEKSNHITLQQYVIGFTFSPIGQITVILSGKARFN